MVEQNKNLGQKISKLEKEISQVKQRNKQVEADKAWELSWTRRGIITLFTYLAIVVYFMAANLPNPFLNSVVPALAFVLSTLSVPYFQKYWKRYVYDRARDERSYTE